MEIQWLSSDFKKKIEKKTTTKNYKPGLGTFQSKLQNTEDEGISLLSTVHQQII